MESTKEVLVTRSNNLFLPFTSNSNMQIDVPFSWDGTGEPLMTCTLQKDGNIRMRGTVTKGAGGGYVSITNLTGGLVFKAGKTYNFSINPDCQCTMQLFRQKDGAWENIYQFSGTWAGGAIKTFTEDTIPTRIFMNFSGSSTVKAGDEIDVLINPMLVEGDTKQDYEPYYHEYESTKEVLVRRSNNLLLPFSSDVNTAVGKNKNFSSDSTLFVTVETDGNIHIHGTKSVANSGWYLISNFTSPLVLKAGKTYSFKCNQPYGNFILQSTVSGSRKHVIVNYGSVTPTIDTPITHIYMDMFSTTYDESNIGKEYDFYINPMLVEGDTKQDYEPYYYEAEASKTEIIPDDGSLTSVVDFSNAVKGKMLDTTDGVTLQTNDVYAYTPDYFPCETGDIFKFTYVGQENIERQTYRQSQIMWYDSNKNFLSSEPKSNWGAITFSAAPENAKFFRLNYSGLLTDKVTPNEWMLPSNPKLTKVTS